MVDYDAKSASNPPYIFCLKFSNGALGIIEATTAARPTDLEGATFTVSNLGAYGVENGTPVIFAPQVALILIASASGARAEPPVEAYGKLPAVEQVSLSPSGDRYVFISVIGEGRKLVAVTADGLTPLYAIDIGPAKVVSVSWAGEDHILVSIATTGPLRSVLSNSSSVIGWASTGVYRCRSAPGW